MKGSSLATLGFFFLCVYVFFFQVQGPQKSSFSVEESFLRGFRRARVPSGTKQEGKLLAPGFWFSVWELANKAVESVDPDFARSFSSVLVFFLAKGLGGSVFFNLGDENQASPKTRPGRCGGSRHGKSFFGQDFYWAGHHERVTPHPPSAKFHSFTGSPHIDTQNIGLGPGFAVRVWFVDRSWGFLSATFLR